VAPNVPNLASLTLSDVEAVAYSPDGETIAFGGTGYVRLIDARTLEQLAEARIDAGATRVAFTGDGSQLAVVESGGEGRLAWITIRDASTLQRIGSPIEPAGFYGLFISEWWTDPSVALTADGRSLVTASVEGELAWWDLESRERTRTLEIAKGYRALALSPDGRTAAIGFDGGIQLIDVRTGAVQEARGALASNPIWLLFSSDGKTIVSTGRDGTVTLWDAGSAALLETLRGHARSVRQPVFGPDGETLYTTSDDGTAIAWDISGDRGLGRPFRFTHDRGLHLWPDRHPGRFSPDGRLIAVGLKEQGIGLWDATDLTRAGAPLLETGGEVNALAFSPDGETLAAVADYGVATIWDVPSRSLRHGPFPVASYAIGVSLSADGRMLATAGDGGVTLWDVATGAELGHIGDGSTGDVAFSPTEPLVAFVREGFLREGQEIAEIWDATRRSRIATLQIAARDQEYFLGWAIAFSPDGRMLATPGIDGSVQLWDVRSGKLVRRLEQNVGTAVLSLEFSPDGETLAISGGEPFASLWDVATGTQIGSRLTAGSRGAMLDLSPDGRRLLMTHANGEGAVWDIDPTSWARRACELANRTLTREEWEEFLPGRPYEPACG
jgi:WD40 repeat protein